MTDFGQGSAYERRFSEATGAAYSVAYGFARHALRGILRGLGFAPGERVVLAPLTCRVVVLALLAERAELAYADVDPETLNLDPSALRAALGRGARAVLFQHTYGGSAGLEEAADVAGRAGVPLIEDRAQCVPQPLPLRGVAAIYSNNLRKPLPAGSGGAATTNDPALAAALREDAARLPRAGLLADARLAAEAAAQRLLLPGFYWPLYALAKRTSPTYRTGALGEEIAAEITATAVRPSANQERIGTRWLARAGDIAETRSACVRRYEAHFAEGRGDLAVPRRAASGPLYYFPLLVREKRALLVSAEREGIELVAWPVWSPIFPLERTESLAKYGYAVGSCRTAEWLARRLVGLATDRPWKDAAQQPLLDLIRRHAESVQGTHGVASPNTRSRAPRHALTFSTGTRPPLETR